MILILKLILILICISINYLYTFYYAQYYAQERINCGQIILFMYKFPETIICTCSRQFLRLFYESVFVNNKSNYNLYLTMTVLLEYIDYLLKIPLNV